MIIDLILERKEGTEYKAREFYNEVSLWEELGIGIAEALDGGSNEDVKRELCTYITEHQYNPDIKNYINSVQWI